MNLYQSQTQYLLLRIEALERENKKLSSKVEELQAKEEIALAKSNVLY
jgi:hypothetical protein